MEKEVPSREARSRETVSRINLKFCHTLRLFSSSLLNTIIGEFEPESLRSHANRALCVERSICLRVGELVRGKYIYPVGRWMDFDQTVESIEPLFFQLLFLFHWYD